MLLVARRGSDYMKVRQGVEEVARLPFSSERKYMATIVNSSVLGRKVVYVKGAPEIVLGLCRGLSEEQIAGYHVQLKDWQMHAQRTLLLAYKEVADTEDDCAALVQSGGLTLLGLAAISDPVRPEVPQAVENCLKAGVQIKVVTGDSTGTAVEIARQIGLWKEGDDEKKNCMRGVDFAALSDEEALQRIKDLKVMMPCPSVGQATGCEVVADGGRSRGCDRRRDERCSGVELCPSRPVDGVGDFGSQGSQ